MRVQSTTSGPLETGTDTIVIGVFEGEGVAHDLPGEPLAKLIESGEARRKLGRLAVVHAEDRRFIVVGLGPRERFDGERARVGAANAHARARDLGARSLCWEVPHHVDDAAVSGLVEGTLLHAYRFERYRPADSPHGPETLTLSAHHEIADGVSRAAIVVSMLVSTPCGCDVRFVRPSTSRRSWRTLPACERGLRISAWIFWRQHETSARSQPASAAASTT